MLVQDPFKWQARLLFDFLEKDHGAKFTEERDLASCGPSIFASVRYDLPSLFVRVYREKGQCGVVLGVKKNSAVLRPYVSHLFELVEVVTHCEGGWAAGTEVIRKALTGARSLHDELLAFRTLFLRYCVPMLKGDLALLEAIAEVRK